MIRLGGVIGGEQSGHTIFLDHHTTGDGIITAMQVVASMVRTGKRLSELSGMMDIFPQKLINVNVKRKPKLDRMPEITQAIKQVEQELGDEGRVLVRYSGTQNMCRVMVEGPSTAITEKYCSQLAEIVEGALG
jgi:phosphoglucosamine mutase